MTDDDKKTLAGMLNKPLSPNDVANLREIAARLTERADANVRFALLVEHYRAARPADVSPRMGFA